MNFDERVRATKTREQYHLDKVKAGRSGSSKGQPRPYAKQNMAAARLYSPALVGQSLTVTPKHPYQRFRPTICYEWQVLEPGYGIIGIDDITADEIRQHFIVKKKH